MRIIGTCLLVLMSFASAAFAAIENPRLATAGGKIASIDSAAQSLIVKVDGAKGADSEMTFVVADDSKIVKDGATAPAGDQKPAEKKSKKS